MGSLVRDISPSERLDAQIHTPFDELIPSSDDSATQYYLDSMRIYLALCAGSITVEAALQAVEILRENPEYTTYPLNPTGVPINNSVKSKLLDNLHTLKKFNLITRDSIRSAYSFAFLSEDRPLAKTDEEALKLFTRNPAISLVEAAAQLDITPRTVARALDRLKELHSLRFTALVDYTAFDLQSTILFFIVKEGFEWSQLEERFARYPLTKSILKTSMTDLGYVTFLLPNFNQTRRLFLSSLREVSNEFFEYASHHYQSGVGVSANLDLYKNGVWSLPHYLTGDIREDDESEEPPILICRGPDEELTQNDLAVATYVQINSRAPPSKISTSLAVRGFHIDARKVAQSAIRLRDRGHVLSYTIFGGIGLSSNFCFEIVCNDEWRARVTRIVSQFPWSMYYQSNRGLVVWTMSPGNHQVEYYQMFRALEQNPGVELVHPIMTIAQGGSRSLLDLTRGRTYENGQWSFEPEEFDLGNYLL